MGEINSWHGELKPEDYVEPACVLCGDPYGKIPESKPVPQDRIIKKLDEYMDRGDYDGAKRHLQYWLEEAKLGNDLRGQLVIRNELIGHFRKTGERDNAFENIKEALELLDLLEFEGTISSGTTYVNAATAYQAFGEYGTAMKYFEKARNVYESGKGVRPELLGGLYNNMATACVSLKRFDEAGQLYEKALEQMSRVPGGELEQAITYLNMADALTAWSAQNETMSIDGNNLAWKGLDRFGDDDLSRELNVQEQVNAWLEHAFSLLDTSDAPHDGYYAFVCEKCAPVFSYYGYFLEAGELEDRAKLIYGK